MDEQKKDDESFSIDFSKVKKWFSEGKQNTPEHHHHEHHHHASQHPSSEDLTMDDLSRYARATASFVHTHRKHLALLLLLIPIYLSVSVRIVNMDVPLAEAWAQDNIINFMRQDLTNKVNAEYPPNLPEANKQRIVQQELDKAWASGTYVVQTGSQRGQGFNIAQIIQQNANEIRGIFQFDVGGKTFTYMPDIDPYTYLRYAENWLDHGYNGDEIKNGQQWDALTNAPIGKRVDNTYHPQTLGILYKIGSVFSTTTPMQAAGYFPLVMVALSIIPLFFIIRLVSGSTLGAFVGATYFATNLAVIGRTLWGHADTDAYNLVFPLVILGLFCLSYISTTRLRIVFALLAGATSGIHSVFWSGWWYMLDFILGASGLALAYMIISHGIKTKSWKTAYKDREVQNIGLSIAGFFAGAWVLHALLNKTLTGIFYNAIFSPFAFTRLKDPTGLQSFWPNVYTTVAELNPGSFGDAVASMGGDFYYYLALLGLVLLLGKALLSSYRGMNKEASLAMMSFLLLTIWLFSTIYAVQKGIRFTFMMGPAAALAVGMALGIIFRFLVTKSEPWLRIDRRITAVVLIVCFGMLFYLPGSLGERTLIPRAYSAGVRDVPLISDGWYNTLTAIKQDSQPDAIITSWWDFGHHFKYYAGRAVTFDGASQNQPMAHWVGKLLSTRDEKQAVAILRMLDCGSRTGFDMLNGELKNFHTTARTINTIILQPRAEAERTLLGMGLSQDNVTAVLRATHCTPPEAYVIASGDMISKSGVWTHFGIWNFERAHAWLLSRSTDRATAITTLVKEANLTAEHAATLYDEASQITDDSVGNAWIAGWPSFQSGVIGCQRAEDAILCSNNILFNVTTQQGYVGTAEGIKLLQSVVLVQNETTTVLPANGSAVPLSMLLSEQDGSYLAVLSGPELAGSLFSRMYFLEGRTLEYFERFKVDGHIGGQLIFTYKTNWTKYLADLGEAPDNGEMTENG